MRRKYLHWGETREAYVPKREAKYPTDTIIKFPCPKSFDEPLYPAAAKESPDEEAKMNRLIEESNQASREASRKLAEKRSRGDVDG